MSNPWIELRSDTFTKPTLEMRQAISSAEVGDDVVGEDPTINRLESMMANLLGKEAAVFTCSGTQANQMAVWTHCRRGDEILIHHTGHIAVFEAGAPAALSGASIRTLDGSGGLINHDILEKAFRPFDSHFPPTRLVCIENTTNIGGGRCYDVQQVRRIADWCQTHGYKLHMDGARLFNAVVARGYSPKDVTQGCDTVSICFSKGLGCPMGSILVGNKHDITLARQARKLFGGGLRQAGIVAAAAIYALEKHIDRLRDDHLNARLLVDGIRTISPLRINPDEVETNLVFFEVDPAWGTAQKLEKLLWEHGVRLYSIGPHRLRAVTHLDVDRAQINHALEILRKCVNKGG